MLNFFKIHFKYLRYVIRHKFWVAFYCFNEGLYWRGLTHDLSKFRPREWFAYANYFNGPKLKHEEHMYTREFKFDCAWLLHQHRNDHHWQSCILIKDNGETEALPMKEKAIMEMICDWRGASRAQFSKDNTPEWYSKNKGNMKLNPLTRNLVETRLCEIYGRGSAEKIRLIIGVENKEEG